MTNELMLAAVFLLTVIGLAFLLVVWHVCRGTAHARADALAALDRLCSCVETVLRMVLRL
ncbi:hypothetical protein [Streptomyces sp. NHF165]|uniref:hypothetical protein n=1 Tax=Streptomyces sp. NHF165 TaxID=2175864 RepID=UPI0013583348|nr:hypothetical protein [Streptomyces sp. NHF165]